MSAFLTVNNIKTKTVLQASKAGNKVNPPRRYNNYICMLHLSHKTYEAKTDVMEQRNRQFSNIVEDFTIPITRQKINKEIQDLNKM